MPVGDGGAVVIAIVCFAVGVAVGALLLGGKCEFLKFFLRFLLIDARSLHLAAPHAVWAAWPAFVRTALPSLTHSFSLSSLGVM